MVSALLDPLRADTDAAFPYAADIADTADDNTDAAQIAVDMADDNPVGVVGSRKRGVVAAEVVEQFGDCRGGIAGKWVESCRVGRAAWDDPEGCAEAHRGVREACEELQDLQEIYVAFFTIFELHTNLDDDEWVAYRVVAAACAVASVALRPQLAVAQTLEVPAVVAK